MKNKLKRYLEPQIIMPMDEEKTATIIYDTADHIRRGVAELKRRGYNTQNIKIHQIKATVIKK